MVPTGLFLPDGTQVGIIFLRPEREYELYVVVDGERIRAVPKVLDPNKPRRQLQQSDKGHEVFSRERRLIRRYQKLKAEGHRSTPGILLKGEASLWPRHASVRQGRSGCAFLENLREGSERDCL